MPARKDFAVLHHRTLLDPRFHDAAWALSNLMKQADPVWEGATKDLGIATALGIEAMLALHLLRQSDDGLFRGDLVRGFQLAMGVSGAVAAEIANAWKAAGLVVEQADGWYLKGWLETYAPLLRKRANDASHKDLGRRAEVARRSRRRSRDVDTRLQRHDDPTVAVAGTKSESGSTAPAAPSHGAPGVAAVDPRQDAGVEVTDPGNGSPGDTATPAALASLHAFPGWNPTPGDTALLEGLHERVGGDLVAVVESLKTRVSGGHGRNPPGLLRQLLKTENGKRPLQDSRPGTFAHLSTPIGHGVEATK